MKVKVKETYICRGCGQLIKKKAVTDFGVWSHTCIKFDIGRNEDSDNCDSYG